MLIIAGVVMVAAILVARIFWLVVALNLICGVC